MNSRDLRLSRRARTANLLVAAKIRRVPAQYDAKQAVSEEAVGGALDLVVSSKAPQPSKDHDVVDEDMSPPVPRHTEEGQWTSGDTNNVEATVRSKESALIRSALSNIERGLACLQQTVISSQCADMISKAVHVCQEALEPLRDFDYTVITEAESPLDQDDSIYFEASDGAGGSKLTDVLDLRQSDPSKVGEVVPESCETPIPNEDSDKPSVSLLLDANMLDDMPKGDKQNLSETLDLRQKGNGHDSSIDASSNGEMTKEEAK